MNDRIAGITRPHLFISPRRGWVCCQIMTRLGWGNSPEAAYASWLRANA